MKRSKIFLGVTTCLLAVAGLTAAKAHKFNTKKAGFYGTRTTVLGKFTCSHAETTQWFTQGSTQALTKISNYPVYTGTSNVGSSGCASKALYSNELNND